MVLVYIMSSCIQNECKDSLIQNHSEIIAYLEENDLDINRDITCNTEIGGISLFGITEINEKGYFFRDSCQFSTLKKSTYRIASLENEKMKGTFSFELTCYEFEDEKELITFENYQPSLSRLLTHNKNGFKFIKKENKWFLINKGMP